MNLNEYINAIFNNMQQANGDGSAVFNPGASNAVICCYNIMSQYAIARRIKSVPVPVMVTNKNIDAKESYTLLKFNLNGNVSLDIDVLYSIVEKLQYSQYVQFNAYGATLNMEISNL